MGLAEQARQAAQRITEEEYVRLVVRRDADGLAAASVLAISLEREGVDLHASFVWELLDDDLRRLGEERPAVLVTVGLGADVLDELGRIAGALVVVDGADSVDGAEPAEGAILSPAAAVHAGEPSVASLAFVLARAIAKRNGDLAGLALAGARASAGTPAALRGLDAEILAEAVGEGRITRGPPLAWPEPILDLLASGVEPVVPTLAGRARAGKRFLDELKIDAAQPASGLDPEVRGLLADRLVRRVLATGAPPGVADGILEPDLRATSGPFAGAPLREVASRLAAAAEDAPADALAHVLGRADAPLAREDPARSLHGLLAAARGGAFSVAESPSPSLLAETARRLHLLDPARPAVAWAPLDGKAALRVLGVPGSTVAEAARASGGRGAGSATRGRAVVPAEARDGMLALLAGMLP